MIARTRVRREWFFADVTTRNVVALLYTSYCCFNNIFMSTLADTIFFALCAKAWNCRANHAIQSLLRQKWYNEYVISIARSLYWTLHAADTPMTTRLSCWILFLVGFYWLNTLQVGIDDKRHSFVAVDYAQQSDGAVIDFLTLIDTAFKCSNLEMFFKLIGNSMPARFNTAV